MAHARPSRRDVLRWSAGALGALAAGAEIAGGTACKKDPPKPFTCTDTTGLADEEARARVTLGYVDHAPEAIKSCVACQQFVASPIAGRCGQCKILKGPVHPDGTCKVFSAKS